MLTWAGSLGAIVQCVTRLATGMAYDRIGFKKIFSVVLFITMVNSLVCYRVRTMPVPYFICILTVFFCFAATYAVFPTPAVKTFGPKYGAQVYSMMVFGACFTSLTNYIIIKVLKHLIGFDGIFGIGSVFTVVAIILISCFDERLDVERLDKLGHIEYVT
jgi:MFS transporter, OFA family, oxalate/formate antiporter